MSRTKIVLVTILLALLLTGCGSGPGAVQTASSGTTSEPTRIASVATTGPVAIPDLPTVTPVPPPLPSLAPTSPPSPTLVPTPVPSPTLAPTSPPSPTLAPAPVEQTAPPPQPTEAPAIVKLITINGPTTGAAVSNPVTVRGSTNFWPFEANLAGRVKDAAGNVIGATGVMVNAPDMGQGGPFEGVIPFTPPATEQKGTIELFEESAEDGSILAIQTVTIRLQAQATPAPPGLPVGEGIRLDAPQEGEAVTLPLHIALHGAQPGEQLLARLRFASGTLLEEAFEVVGGTDGEGYAVVNLNWNTESAPPPFGPGPATLELTRADGTLLQSIGVTILPDDSTQWVQVAWAPTGGGEDLIVFRQRVPKTPQIASAALRELARGPQEGNLAGAVTAFPSTQEIVAFPGRQPDWGYVVQLIKLTITDGVATANFSKELRAYGGGSERVRLIRLQIEQTLRQFPSVREVVIQIEGQSEGVLEP